MTPKEQANSRIVRVMERNDKAHCPIRMTEPESLREAGLPPDSVHVQEARTR